MRLGAQEFAFATCIFALRLLRKVSFFVSGTCNTVTDLFASVVSICGSPPIYSISAEVLGVIMEIAGPRTMLPFAGTCRAFRTAFLSHMRIMVFRAVNEFALPAREFMRAMLMTSSVIAGSVAANVVTGSRYEPSALDVVTPASEEHSMLAILQQDMGCILVESTVPLGMQGSLRMMYEFERKGRSIKLWIAAGENPTVPIMLTNTTFVMNFISSWGIYCAYPTLTLSSRGLVNHFTYADDDGDGNATFSRVNASFFKYVNRGVAFEVDDRSWADTRKRHRCFVSATCPHTIRSLYDNAGLYIAFPVEYDGVKTLGSKSTRLDRNQTTIWSLGGGYCNEPPLYHAAFAQSKSLYILVRVDCVVVLLC
jgi:hypothetical protein